MFAGYLNEPNGTDWYLPTYFGVKFQVTVYYWIHICFSFILQLRLMDNVNWKSMLHILLHRTDETIGER